MAGAGFVCVAVVKALKVNTDIETNSYRMIVDVRCSIPADTHIHIRLTALFPGLPR